MKRLFRTCVAVCVSAGCLALLARGVAAGAAPAGAEEQEAPAEEEGQVEAARG